MAPNLHASRRGPPLMTTSALIPQRSLSIREWASRSPLEDFGAVQVTRSVNADRQRLFQALTLPEYIEAWFSAPEAVAGSSSVALSGNGFLVSCRGREAEWLTIRCSYRACRRSKLVFDWNCDQHFTASPSLVKIRLNGDFERTTVNVLHVGLDPSLQSWHQKLWKNSLEKLASLF